MRLGIGLGLFKAGLISAGVRIFSAFQTRVIGDGGTVEAGTCVVNGINGSALLQQASLLLIPSGFKGGKLYSEIPTNGNGDLTWTRGSDAFRTNASGLLQRVPWNLFTASEDLSSAAWAKQNVTISTNTTTAPNGTLTADKVIPDTTSAQHQIYGIVNFLGEGVLSFYAKADGYNFVSFGTGGGISGGNIFFNLTNGTISGSAVGFTPSIQNVGNGWYRCSVYSSTMGAGINFSYWIIVRQSESLSNYTGNGTSGVYIWGAQLVEGTTAQTYLPTTDRLNFPRLSYMYGSCPAVLAEPQRTNLALWSEDITSAVWLKARLNTTANTTTSPDGTTNADTIAANGSNSDHTLYNLYTTTEGTAYTFSCYLKANTGRYVLLRIMTTGATFRYGITFDLQTGTITQTSTTATAPSGTSNTITNVGNGWYRISLTLTASGTQSGVIVATSNSATPTLNANLDYVYTGSESYYLYGMQLEAGAYPTTYIPTTSATATRVADSFSRNNIYTNGLISASGGTWFVELRNNVAYIRDSGGFGISLANNNTTYDFGFLILTNTGGAQRISILKRVSGIGTSIYTTTTDTTKIAIKWNGSTADVFANGTKVVSATSFTTTQMELLTANILDTPKFIQQMALFPTPLSDAQCQTLTTL